MRFKVLKAGIDGIFGGNTSYAGIEAAAAEVLDYRGWDNRGQLRDAIRRWAADAVPGSAFASASSVIVAVGADRGPRQEDACVSCAAEGLEYGPLEVNEQAEVVQRVRCPACATQWEDVFVLADRRAPSGGG